MCKFTIRLLLAPVAEVEVMLCILTLVAFPKLVDAAAPQSINKLRSELEDDVAIFTRVRWSISRTPVTLSEPWRKMQPGLPTASEHVTVPPPALLKKCVLLKAMLLPTMRPVMVKPARSSITGPLIRVRHVEVAAPPMLALK